MNISVKSKCKDCMMVGKCAALFCTGRQVHMSDVAQFGTYVCLYAHSFALVSVFFVMDLSLTHCEFAGNPSCQFPESLLFLNTVQKKKQPNNDT